MTNIKRIPAWVVAVGRLQGWQIIATKARDWTMSNVMRLQVENNIVPVIRKIAQSRRFCTYIDVGAADGDTLVPVSSLFSNCLGVEPTPELFELLSRSVTNLSNVRLVQAALAEQSGEAELFYGRSLHNNSVVRLPGLKLKRLTKLETLDALVARFGFSGPMLIKVDTEGNDLHVLRGAEKTLSGDCLVITEFWPRALINARTYGPELIEFMKRKGFSVFNLNRHPVREAELNRFISISLKVDLATSLIFAKTRP